MKTIKRFSSLIFLSIALVIALLATSCEKEPIDDITIEDKTEYFPESSRAEYDEVFDIVLETKGNTNMTWYNDMLYTFTIKIAVDDSIIYIVDNGEFKTTPLGRQIIEFNMFDISKNTIKNIIMN